VSLIKLTGAQQVFEPPELVKRTQPEGLAIGPKAHRAVERALENSEFSVGATSEEEELARPRRKSLPVW
jgi:hypothetical protein